VSAARIDLDAARRAEEMMSRIATTGSVSREILTRLKGLPVLLRTSGLAAVLAYCEAKSGQDALGGAYRQVAALLREELGVVGGAVSGGGVYQRLARLSAPELALAQGRAEAVAGWLRRLAEAEENRQRAGRADNGAAAQPAGTADQPGDADA
jgi:hypothetical protein